jgi:hypothetical protein
MKGVVDAVRGGEQDVIVTGVPVDLDAGWFGEECTGTTHKVIHTDLVGLGSSFYVQPMEEDKTVTGHHGTVMVKYTGGA